MASGNSSLIKGVFVLLFIGAVFAGLTFILEESPEETPIATTPTSSDDVASDDPAIEEARAIGAQIGARVGEEIGRRVGETLVASLDMPESDAQDSSDESMMVADADSEETPAEESAPVKAETSPEVTDDSEAEIDTAEVSEDESIEFDGSVMDSEPEAEATVTAMAEPEMAEPEAETTPSHTIANEPAIPAPKPVTESEPDPSKNFVFSSSGWWNASANGKGLRIIHVGQAVSASGLNKSIVVILSAPYLGSQNLEQKINVSAANGNKVNGVWRRSANARNLFLHVDQAGTYEVSFSADLASRDGLSLGMDLAGPVTIQ